MADKAQALTLEETKQQYHGQWLAVVLTARDDADQPVAGVDVAQRPTRLEVCEAVKAQRDICLPYAGEPIPKGYGFLDSHHVAHRRDRPVRAQGSSTRQEPCR